MRRIALSLAFGIASLGLAACGGGGSAQPVELAPSTTLLSFGAATPSPEGLTTDEVVVSIFNHSTALILDAGIRRFGSTEAHQGGLAGHDPTNYGNPQTGSFWVSLPVGTYEGFLETDHGVIEFVGSIPAIQLPDGTYTAGPADLYLFEFDLPNPNPGGGGEGGDPFPGGGAGGGGGGGITPGGGGILP